MDSSAPLLALPPAPEMLSDYMGHIPFARQLGIRVTSYEDGRSTVTFDPKPEHLNNFGVVHGGASMTLLDVTMAAAARSMDKALAVVTIEMKTSFLQPARGPLVARGRLIHRTTGMAFVEATVEDAAGLACVHGTGTFKYVKRPSTPDSIDPQTPAPAPAS